jgi:adenylate cyclase
MTVEILKIIEDNHLFAGLSGELLHEIASSASKTTLGSGQILFRKGDRANALWGVVSGRIVTQVTAGDGKELVLDVYDAGDVFGEVGVLDFGPRPVDAVAETRTELFRLDRRQFLEHLHTSPELCFKMFALLCNDLRESTAALEDTALYTLPGRLAKKLVNLVNHNQDPTTDPLVINISHNDLARLLGVHRVSVSRQLSQWEKAGLLLSGRQRIEIRNLQALLNLAPPGQDNDPGLQDWGEFSPGAHSSQDFHDKGLGSSSEPSPEPGFRGILAVDATEYSQSLVNDAAGTFKRLKAGMIAIDKAISDGDGRLISHSGDRVLADFHNVDKAYEAAQAIHDVIDKLDIPRADHAHSVFRIGVHYGEVLADDHQFSGKSVNTAIGLTQLAGAGGIAISATVRDALKNREQLDLQFLGDHQLKNVPGTVAVYSARTIPLFKLLMLRAETLLPRRFHMTAGTSALIVLLAGIWFGGEQMGRKGTPFPVSQLSVAVLPFVDLSADEAGVLFSDGMHAEVLTKLGKLAGVKVISRNSVLGYQDASRDLHSIGEELGVSTIMEGSVKRMEDRLHVNLQLIDVTTDEHLWAETYDRELTASNMFAIQSEIANAVAQAFGIELSVDEQRQISSRPTENTAAYEAYLMGKHLLAKRTIPAMQKSAEFFQQAITLDPDYALAYVGLADALYVLEWYGDRPSEKLLAESRNALDRALELDDSLGEAYASLGAQLDFTDLEQSEEAYKRSIELSPNYATAYHWYGTTLRQRGRLEEAGILFEKARELDPLSAIVNAEIGEYLEELGHFDEARAQMEKVLTIDPGLGEIYRDLAALIDTAYRRIDEALAHLHKEISISGTSVLAEPLNAAWVCVNIAQLYLQIGVDDKAEFWIDKALDLTPDHIGARITMLKLRLLQGEAFEVANYPRERPQIHRGLAAYDLLQIRDVKRLVLYHDLRAGQYAQVRERYARYYPELLQAIPPDVNRYNYAAAINLALLLAATGEENRSKQLLEYSLQVFESMPRLGKDGFQIADVLIFAIQGKKEKTLAALREAIDDGWQFNARYILEFEPSLFSLHPDPEYQAMVAEVKADLAEQRKRVQEMEHKGELNLHNVKVIFSN